MCFSYSQEIRNSNTLASFEVMFIILFTLFFFIMCKLVQGYPTYCLFKDSKITSFILLVL